MHQVTRGWIGVAIQNLDQELKEYYDVDKGVLIAEVFEGDPAEEAGIRTNDIILEINGKPVDSSRDLTRLIAGLDVGSSAKIKVNREGKEKMFKVKIARRDMDQLLASGSDDSRLKESKLGVDVSDITPEISKKFNLGDTDGVIVVNVAPDSKGAKAGIAQGDIIMEINHQPVNDVSDYNEIIDDVEKGDAVQMYLRRMNKGYMVVKIIK